MDVHPRGSLLDKTPQALLGLLALPCLVACGPFQGLCVPSPEAVGVLQDLAAGKPGDTQAVERRAIAYEQAGSQYRGDLYRPAQRAPQAGIVLVPGAATGGKDDPRLVALANALASRAFAVLVPEIPSLRELRVSPGDVRYVADAFAYLQSQPALAPAGRAGLAGISYAAGPAFLAALEPDLRHRVRFIVSVGGYHDLAEVITFFTTGYFRENGAWRSLPPAPYGKWVFVLSNAAYLADPNDRAALRALAERKIADPAAEVPTPPLGPEGEALWALLTNTDPERVPALMARLPETIRRPMAALDLADKDLRAIQARVILVHGRDDDLIPYPQSEALAQALPPGRARLSIVEGLFHVDLKGLRVMDVWRLSCAIGALLDERGP